MTATASSQRKLIVLLDKANLESVRIGKGYELLNCDDHQSVLRKHGRDTGDARPDITHQCLLTLLDSPLNKAGLLQIYIRTAKGVCIEVSPHTRIPRTFPRFCGLMVQLLHKLSIRATNGPEKLMRVIKNPITDHFPPNCRIIGTTQLAPKTMDATDYALSLPDDRPLVFVVGAIAHGEIDLDMCEDTISISHFPLSASVVCGKLCNAFERKWDVL